MIAVSVHARRSRATDAGLAMVLAVIAGSALLLVRTSFIGLPVTVAVFAALYVVLGSASLAATVTRGDASSLSPVIVTASSSPRPEITPGNEAAYSGESSYESPPTITR